MLSIMLAFFKVATIFVALRFYYALGHGYLVSPIPRQVYYKENPVPGVENPYQFDENSLYGGGVAVERAQGHGLCGDSIDRQIFTAPSPLGPVDPSLSGNRYMQGSTIEITVRLTAHHYGWFEMRLCKPATEDTPVTQECFNQNVLEMDVDATTADFEAQSVYTMDSGLSSPADYNGGSNNYRHENTKCPNIQNALYGSNGKGPSGSCCNGGTAPGSSCTFQNRWVIPQPAGSNLYVTKWRLPADLTCARCTLQWFYQTGNSPGGYPEGFWNCADIEIYSNDGTSSPTVDNTEAPTTSQTPAPTTATAAPSSSESEVSCGDCSGCLWIEPNACYGDWDRETCERYDGYFYCDSSNPGEPSQAPTTTTAAPTASTDAPTNVPTVQDSSAPSAASTPTLEPTYQPSPLASDSGIAEILTEELFDQIFRLRSTAPSCSQGISVMTYSSLIAAAEYFPLFGNTGGLDTRRREIAAFLGQVSQETSGWWPGQPYEWGGCFVEEVACASSGCQQYSDNGNVEYPPVAGKSYHGRGPMQISWNYNYGALSAALYGDKTVLLDDPDLLLSDNVVAWRSALWFWMTPQSPKPSCHAVMTGQAEECTVQEFNRFNGYGHTTNIINGGLECTIPTPQKVVNRVEYFRRYCSILGTTPGDYLYCDNMKNYLFGACPSSSTPAPTEATSAPSTAGSTPAPSPGSGNGNCGSCVGCLWVAYSACYTGWSQEVCDRYNGYLYCPP